MRSKKVIGSILFISLLIISFLAGAKYSSIQDNHQDRKYYLNHIYFELDASIRLLSSADSWDKGIDASDLTRNPYRQLLERLNTMKLMSEQVLFYMRDDKEGYFLNDLSKSFDLIERAVGSGVNFNNNPICNDFLADGVISNAEISFFNSLKKDFETIKSGLYSEKLNQENPDLSMKDLQKAVQPFIDKYSVSNIPNLGLKN